MAGADYSRGPLPVGLSVGRTLGLGGYRGPSGGRMSRSMTGFHPWVGCQVNDRVSVWGATRYGAGALSLAPDGASMPETDVSMITSAVGTRGEPVGSRATARPRRRASDARSVRWRSRSSMRWRAPSARSLRTDALRGGKGAGPLAACASARAAWQVRHSRRRRSTRSSSAVR